MEKEIAIASTEKKVKDYNLKEFSYLISGLIHRTHAECGQKEDADSIDITIDMFIKDLREYNKNISYQEIELAFRNGFKNEYGEWFGLNNKTYFQWVNGYTMSVARKQAIKNRELLLVPAEIKLSEEEKNKIIHEGALMAFSQFKEKGFVLDVGNVNYNYLDSKGVFNFTKARKVAFMEQAKINLQKEAAKNLDENSNQIARMDIRRSLGDITSDKSDKVIAEAKRIALNTFFADLVEMDIELETKL